MKIYVVTFIREFEYAPKYAYVPAISGEAARNKLMNILPIRTASAGIEMAIQ